MNILEILNKNTIKDCGDLLVAVCHNASVHAGWWHDLTTGALKPVTQELVGDKLMLCVTELAEAKEGHRKDAMDSHLPNRSAIEVELADCIIRICDLAGRLELDLGGAIAEKLAYNSKRSDHTIAARMAPGGKKT